MGNIVTVVCLVFLLLVLGLGLFLCLLLGLLVLLLFGGLLLRLRGGGLVVRFWGGSTTKKLRVKLLAFLERFLELRSICTRWSGKLHRMLMAEILTLSICEPDCEGLRGRGVLRVVSRDLPHPAAV